MAYAKLVAFDRLLAGAAWPGRGRMLSEAEAAAQAQTAYNAGVDAARAAADQQLVEMRADVARLSEGVLDRLAQAEPAMMTQLREALPGLALEIARRLLAGFEPPPEAIERMWREALEHLYPEREGLELSLCPRDASLLEQINPEWKQRYPGLRVRSDESLAPGDCMVRSRFGLTDARRQAKLESLERGLAAN
ncbi:MAG: FliH/SctL family protein [Opitutaceae bacterium]